MGVGTADVSLVISALALVLNICTILLNLRNARRARRRETEKDVVKVVIKSKETSDNMREVYGARAVIQALWGDLNSVAAMGANYAADFALDDTFWQGNPTAETELKTWFRCILVIFPCLYTSLPADDAVNPQVYPRIGRQDSGDYWVWPILFLKDKLLQHWSEMLVLLRQVEGVRDHQLFHIYQQAIGAQAKEVFCCCFPLLLCHWLYNLNHHWHQWNRQQPLPANLYSLLMERPECRSDWQLLCQIADFADEQSHGLGVAQPALKQQGADMVHQAFNVVWRCD